MEVWLAQWLSLRVHYSKNEVAVSPKNKKLQLPGATLKNDGVEFFSFGLLLALEITNYAWVSRTLRTTQ
jgi:hypothetical protein